MLPHSDPFKYLADKCLEHNTARFLTARPCTISGQFCKKTVLTYEQLFLCKKPAFLQIYIIVKKLLFYVKNQPFYKYICCKKAVFLQLYNCKKAAFLCKKPAFLQIYNNFYCKKTAFLCKNPAFLQIYFCKKAAFLQLSNCKKAAFLHKKTVFLQIYILLYIYIYIYIII